MNTRTPTHCPIRATGDARWLMVPRVIVALPLAGFGSLHLTGMTPLLEILTRASIPLPAINYYVAPLVMVAAGLSVGFGFFAGSARCSRSARCSSRPTASW